MIRKVDHSVAAAVSPHLIGDEVADFILFRVGSPLTEDMNVSPRRSPVASGALTMFKIYELTKGYRPAFGGVAAR